MSLPERIGPYTVLKRLGKGGMGSVYKVLVPDSDKIAALKILDPFEIMLDILGKDKIASLFAAEARIIAKLESPYVVTVRDTGVDSSGTPFFVMEFYCNNLGAIIGEHYQTEKMSRLIPPQKTLQYGTEILQGLACLHKSGIIHRDIKPYNILISDQDTIKICDFGLSRERGETAPTPAGFRVGSPYYAAPEQERDPDLADASSDLYSVGVLLYRMLTGELPSMKNFMLSMVNPLYDPKWDAFFAKAINLQKENRFQSAEEMLEALTDLHLHWEKAKKAACALPHTFEIQPSTRAPLRTHSARVSGKNAQQLFQTNELFQPAGGPLGGPFILSAEGEFITDQATTLIWQRSGANERLNFEQAGAFIAALNATRHGGYSSWRLPTVNELFSIIHPQTAPQDGLCLPHPFDHSKDSFWSCDRRSNASAWYVNTEMAFADWQDTTCLYFVKAVCSLCA